MTLCELLEAVTPCETVDVYSTTESDTHLTIYEGDRDHCPTHLDEREVCTVWAAGDILCIGIDMGWV